MALTKEQIFTAADELAAAGQNATLAAVRKALGGGSFTTISEAMAEWKARQQTTAAPLREPAPQAIADRLAELGADVWGVALELANARLVAERDALEAARAEMEAAKLEATELADQVSADLEALQVRCTELEGRAVSAEKDAADLRGQLVTVQEQAHTAEARAVEIERRAGELRAELDRAHADAATQRTKLEKAEAHGYGLTDRVNDLQGLLYEATAKAQRVEAELATVKAKADAADQSHQEQRKQAAAEAHRAAERMTKAEAERDTARKEAGAAREDAAKLRGQLEAMQTQAADLMRTLAGRQAPEAEAKAATTKTPRAKKGE